jgi:protocatechuate 3,4-dioxygenase beta subunit
MSSFEKSSSFKKSPSFGRSLLSRRAALTTLASAPAIVSCAPGAFAQTPAAPAVALTPACILTPAAVPGPFYFDPKLQRADITEGNPGVPLRLRFIVLDAADCTPVSGARVDVWHTRADGYYSGYPGQGDKHNVDTSGGTFMRGTQIADGRGEAAFRSVYPGWYGGRTVHVHFKVFIDDKDMLTGQMYFPDALSQYIFANVGAYTRKAVRNTFNNNDDLALSDTTRGGFCDIREQADHYLATLVVGVSRKVATVLGESPTPPALPRAIVPGIAPTKQRNG